MKKINFTNSSLFLVVLLLVLLGGCKEEPIVYNTTEDVNITGYFEKYPEEFSEFKKILDITGTSGFLQAYGSYTIFAPNNAGVEAFLKAKGKNSVEELDVEELKNIVKFHLLEDTISTPKFTDGKLPRLTMYGQYLTTGAQNSNNVTRITVNRQANVVKPNVLVGNGVIHVIDNVLQPASQTLAQMLESNPNYSIFTQALKATGLFESLNKIPATNTDVETQWLTVVAESNQTLASKGFNSFDALKARYSHTGNPANPADSLNLFVKYHILKEAKYLADIVSVSSHATLAPLEIVTSSLLGQRVLLNDAVFNGVHEPGVEINRQSSDLSARNGVLHDSQGHFVIKVRKPQRVDWDVAAECSDLAKIPGVLRQRSLGTGAPAYNDSFAPRGFTELNDLRSPGVTGIGYEYGTSGSLYGAAWWGDFLTIPLGGPNRNPWIELRSPMIIKGTYKVWINYRSRAQSANNSQNLNEVSIDGVPLPRLMNFVQGRPSGTEAELEGQGWKAYTAVASSNHSGRLVGTIEIKTTDRHWVKFTTINGTQNTNHLDMIQFIPVSENQLYPKFHMDGRKLGPNGEPMQ
ncbi:fasciclin domain-containing protein [Pedobacter sp. SYSU D00535]|uniref:fasciclin domain-containing protein n=1 Tax=Pedobacter sp. SYSU D00535 TaxID=2810308 RepID=UPI001A96B000|nr:fasciclin domain-containing protein [Pedobacter sp. SYSU D00535]